jgi:hypothetical protein
VSSDIGTVFKEGPPIPESSSQTVRTIGKETVTANRVIEKKKKGREDEERKRKEKHRDIFNL